MSLSGRLGDRQNTKKNLSPQRLRGTELKCILYLKTKNLFVFLCVSVVKTVFFLFSLG
jgi:hypothetical protein